MSERSSLLFLKTKCKSIKMREKQSKEKQKCGKTNKMQIKTNKKLSSKGNQEPKSNLKT